jgi:hypothetical protein
MYQSSPNARSPHERLITLESSAGDLMNEKYIQSLRDAIQKTHGCISRYIQTVPVKEESNGHPPWDGKVEVFDLAGHRLARQCYGWGHKDDSGRWQYITILRIPPIDSPRQAVQSYLAGQQKP